MASCVQVLLFFIIIKWIGKGECLSTDSVSLPRTEEYGYLESTEKLPRESDNLIRVFQKRALKSGIPYEEENEDLSKLPVEVTGEMDTSATSFFPFPVKPIPPLPPPPEEFKPMAEMNFDTGFYTNIKKALPVFDYLKGIEQKEITKPVIEKKEFEPEVVPPPPPPPPPPPVKPFLFEAHKKEEKDIKIELPNVLDPFVSRTRMALHFGNVLVHALSKLIERTEVALNKYIKPKEE